VVREPLVVLEQVIGGVPKHISNLKRVNKAPFKKCFFSGFS